MTDTTTQEDRPTVFGSSAIRHLSRNEEIFARGKHFIGLTVRLRGSVEPAAMSRAFDTLLQVHPVLAGHLEPAADGRHQIMADDFLHPGIWLEKMGQDTPDTASQPLPDQSVALVNLRLRLGGDRAELTLYTHHALADAHHQFVLLEKLFGWYTDVVTGAGIAAVKPEATPRSLEAVLAERGITKQQHSGLERFMPAMFVYNLPPSKRNPGGGDPLPVRVPSASCRLSRQETKGLADICAAQRVSVNSVVGSAILLAEWRIRNTPHIPVPYVYPVDLRYVLTPPVGATEATNPIGVATYLAEIQSDTDLMDLARDIVESFRADISDGVIQQSLLHSSLEYAGNPPGLPDVVMITDGGETPPVRTPPDLEIEEYDGEVLFASSLGIDMYSIAIYDGELVIQYHTHAPGRERCLAESRELLLAIPTLYSWATD
jgi:phenolphthiocerol/phthiocerol/phthiodiolone dimycocerosyl transferase